MKIWKTSLMTSLGAMIYIVLVSLIMASGERIFGQMTGILGPVAFLLLFVLSAMVVGALVLGKPIMLYLDNKKHEAISMFMTSIGWMAALTILSLVVLAIVKS